MLAAAQPHRAVFLPYSTDAPIVYRPYATLALVVANLTLFLSISSDDWNREGSVWLLHYGEGLHPVEWVASRFVHQGPLSLAVNLMFLGAFGIVVEGKLGPLGFLGSYLAILVGAGLIEQASMQSHTGDPSGTVGAAPGVYGLMAMALIWAPRYRVLYYWGVLMPGFSGLRIPLLAVIYLALDMTLVYFFSGLWPQAMLHASGLVVGVFLATVLLQAGLVLGGGQDLLTMFGAEKKIDFQLELQSLQKAKEEAEKVAQRKQWGFEETRREFDECLAAGAGARGLQLYHKLGQLDPTWQFSVDRLVRLTQILQAEKRWVDVAPLLAQRIDSGQEDSNLLRITLAQICVKKLSRPGRALEVLQQIDYRELNRPQRDLAHEMIDRARQMINRGELEIDAGGW